MKTFTPEALKWLKLVINERFGNECDLSYTEHGLSLTYPKLSESEIIFSNQISDFIKLGTNPKFTYWDASKENWQSVLEKPLSMPGFDENDLKNLKSPLIEIKGPQTIVHYDILGLTYWMLNRIEEINSKNLDNHGRFPATSSHAYKHGYLERPIVDEWLHILDQIIVKTWPDIKLKQNKFSLKVSHDVDSPSLYAFKPWKTIIRMMGGHLLKRRDIKSMLQAPYFKLTGSKQIPANDPYNTFDWIMSTSEKNNLTSAFYFICGGNNIHDAEYKPEDIRIRKLMCEIHNRGHEIGLHPSYDTYQNANEISNQADRLRKACAEEGIDQDSFGGRMHYLRWQHPYTLQAWEDAGMAYDSTLSYADRPGFRCGTCYEYPAFNHETQQILNLRIRPLIAMECSIIDDAYLGLGYSKKAKNKFFELKDKCKKVNGCFTLLWHNSHFMHKNDFDLYEYILVY